MQKRESINRVAEDVVPGEKKAYQMRQVFVVD